MENKPVDEVFSSTLSDGTSVQLRRLNDGDFDAVIALHGTLTDDELYLRFFTPHPTYLKSLAHKLTECSDKYHALGAFQSGTLIGVASYAICDRPATAEVAIVVAHNDHLRGVGTILLRHLAQIARDNGIQHFVADIWVTNHLMFKVLRDAGLHPQHEEYRDCALHLDVDLTEIAAGFDLTETIAQRGVDLGRPKSIGVTVSPAHAGVEHR